MKYIIAIAVGLAIGSTAMLVFAQDALITAKVPCNEFNAPHSVLCLDTTGRPVSGQIYGTEFYTIWINPELMLFWTPTTWWYVTPQGIVYP